MVTVVTACTSRKRFPASDGMRGGQLPLGPAEVVAKAWLSRVEEAPRVGPAADVYRGRSFGEAAETARRLNAPLLVVSAGLGTVPARSPIPAYSLTVSPGSADNVIERLEDHPAPARWWHLVSRGSPIGISVAEAVRVSEADLILLALPSTYLTMVEPDLLTLDDRYLGRVRIFTGGFPGHLDRRLQPLVMPYDDRLDGADSPRPGTRSDFAARALKDFALAVLAEVPPNGGARRHRDTVTARLAGWAQPNIPVRRRRTDAELLAAMREGWQDAGGRSARMLRLLRDKMGLACEQSRFRQLFRRLRDEMGVAP